MKSPEEALGQVKERLRTTWSQVVTGTAAWSPDFHLGTSSLRGPRLLEAWPETHRDALRWRDWASVAGEGIELVVRSVSVHRTAQELPATLRVDTIDTAARLIGGDWGARLERARARFAMLADQFPELEDPAAMLRATDPWSEVDFELLCRSASWFAQPHPPGLTARQIPVEGMGTKWLDARRGVVRQLAGVEDLQLVPGRPQRVHLTYLDPDHLASGGRRHDVATHGDVDALAYRPRVVVISENRDTAQLFAPIPDGIAIEGDGRGAGAVAGLSWVHEAEMAWYWGDMDADGLEILHGYRAAGLTVRSMFMDIDSYRRWERFGVDHDHRGKPLGSRPPRETGELVGAERELYLALCSPEWTRHRRIEQERIPLADAAAVVRAG
ncbi:MAG: DUF2220 family protein [Nocardioides sp.]|nr:DUF2220 family protein [Nocardioides sp.]